MINAQKDWNTPTHLVSFDLERRLTLTLVVKELERNILIKLIPAKAFYYPEFFEIIKLLQECVRENKPVDMIFFEKVLGAKVPKQLLVDTFFPPLSDLMDFRTCEWAIRQLKELYFSRVAWNVGEKIKSNTLDSKESRRRSIILTQALNSFSSNLFEERRGNLFDKAVDITNSPEEYIKAPYDNLANMIGGFTLKDVSAIGGKSGHNKTTFAISMATESIKKGLVDKILYISADEEGEKVARRIIAKEMRIKTSDMRNKRITLDANEVKRAVTTVFKDKLIILDDITAPQDIATAILDIKPKQVIIDHLQELDYGDLLLSDQAVTQGLTRMKIASRTAGANLLILSQVRDKLIDERIEDKVPRPHDFLYGSDVRRKSRELMVVYWRYKDDYNKDTKHIFELYVHKSTYSETGLVKFRYNPEYAEFIPLTEESTDTPRQQRGSVWSD